MPDIIEDLCPLQIHLSGNWEVCPIPLDVDDLPQLADADTVDLIEFGSFTLFEQDNSLATPAPKITKADAKIDWNKII